jgi:hypothetical protein
MVPVVDRLSRTTKDNLLESGRLSRNAKLNTRKWWQNPPPPVDIWVWEVGNVWASVEMVE